MDFFKKKYKSPFTLVWNQCINFRSCYIVKFEVLLSTSVNTKSQPFH